MKNAIVTATVFYVLLASCGVVFGMELEQKKEHRKTPPRFLQDIYSGDAPADEKFCSIEEKMAVGTREVGGRKVNTVLAKFKQPDGDISMESLLSSSHLAKLCNVLGDQSQQPCIYFRIRDEQVAAVSRGALEEYLINNKMIAKTGDNTSGIRYKPTAFQSLSSSSPTPRVANFLGEFDGYQVLDGDITSTICLLNKTDTEFSNDPRTLLELKRKDSENSSEAVAVNPGILQFLRKTAEQQSTQQGHMKLGEHVVPTKDLLEFLKSDAIEQLLMVADPNATQQQAATQPESRRHQEEAADLLQTTPRSVTFLDLSEENSDDKIISPDSSEPASDGDADINLEGLPHIDASTGRDLIESLQNVDDSEDGSEEEVTKKATEDQNNKKPEPTDPMPLPEEQEQGFLERIKNSTAAIIAKVQKSAEEAKEKAEGQEAEAASTFIMPLRQAVGDIRVEKYKFDDKIHTIAIFNIQTPAFGNINLVEEKVYFSQEEVEGFFQFQSVNAYGTYAIIAYGAVEKAPIIVSSVQLAKAVADAKIIEINDRDGYHQIVIDFIVNKLRSMVGLKEAVSSPKMIGNYVAEDTTVRTLFEFANVRNEQALVSHEFERYLNLWGDYIVIANIDGDGDYLSGLPFILSNADYADARQSAQIQAVPFFVDMQYSTQKPDTIWEIADNGTRGCYLDSDSNKIIFPLTFQNEKNDILEKITIRVLQDCIEGFSSEEDGYITITFQDVFSDKKSELTVPARALRGTYTFLAEQIEECTTKLSAEKVSAADNAKAIVWDLEAALRHADDAHATQAKNAGGAGSATTAKSLGGAEVATLLSVASGAKESGRGGAAGVKKDEAKGSSVIPVGSTVQPPVTEQKLAPSSSYSYLKIGGTVLALSAATTAFLYSFKQLPPRMMDFIDNFFAQCNLRIDKMRISWFASPSKE